MHIAEASDIVRDNSLAYSKHILSNTFPCPIDGLKKVKRRIIYTQPLDSSFGGMKMVSNAIGIHPYGDSSIYDAACNLTDSYRNTFPLITILSKRGSYGGDRVAAAKYTEFKLSDFCKDIFFNGINFKTIPMEPTEDLMGREIQYFIPKIPMALLVENESIGFGYSSHTIPMKFENICDLTVDFVSCKDKPNWNYQRMAKYFLPCLPIHVFIKNEAELIQAYTEGKFNHPVDTEGLYVIESNNTVLFRTLAYGIATSVVRDSLTIACDKNSKMTAVDASLEALSENRDYTDFKLTIKRGANIFEFIDNIKGIVRVRTPAYAINNFVFNSKMLQLTPPDIINMWYKERYRSIFNAKKHRQQELQVNRMRLETYLVVCGHVDEVVSIISSDELDAEGIYATLKKRFELSTRQCEVLMNVNLQILMKSKHKELEEKLAKTNADLEEVNDSFKYIDKEICTEVKALKKKYKTDMTFTSRESNFIGCLIVGELGILQVNNLSEISDTGKMFHNVVTRFIPYYSGIVQVKFNKAPTTYSRVVTLPKSISSTGISIQYKKNTHLFIRQNGKSRCIPDAPFVMADKSIINYVSDKPLVISNKGRITEAPPELFDNRKHSTDILYAFDPIQDTEQYVILSVNAAHPGVIRLHRLKNMKGKILFSAAGETAIVGVFNNNVDEAIIQLPTFHKYSTMIVTDIQKHLAKKDLNDVTIRSFEKM